VAAYDPSGSGEWGWPVPKYIVFSKVSAKGSAALKGGPSPLADLAAAVDAAGGKILEQYALIGPHDFCTFVEVRDNDAAQLLELAERSDSKCDTLHQVIPVIDVTLFTRLLGQSTGNTGPYRWQISWPARIVRRIHGRFATAGYSNVAKTYFEPLEVIGAEHVKALRGPAIFIANHASFMDAPAMWAALPRRYRYKIAWPAAADRFFIKGRKEWRKQGWYFSLLFNSFPLRRGGGRAALAHADWLIDKGWSIGIFPEGARTSAAKLARFRMGPALLAVSHGVPVVPMFLEGLGAIRAKGSQEMRPGPVTVRVGPPLRFPPDADPAEANKELHRAVSALAQEAAEVRRAQRPPGKVVDVNGAGTPDGQKQATVPA
jgi:1-acyl-sn-glycerol-3-phosphate acyltransferase